MPLNCSYPHDPITGIAPNPDGCPCSDYYQCASGTCGGFIFWASECMSSQKNEGLLFLSIITLVAMAFVAAFLVVCILDCFAYSPRWKCAIIITRNLRQRANNQNSTLDNPIQDTVLEVEHTI